MEERAFMRCRDCVKEVWTSLQFNPRIFYHAILSVLIVDSVYCKMKPLISDYLIDDRVEFHFVWVMKN